jgi:uncharacterized ferritin-like protein (DUF455 family)
MMPRMLTARRACGVPTLRSLACIGGGASSPRAVSILDIILRDEIGHVAIGNHWYRVLCTKRGLEPLATYAHLAAQYGAPRLKGPLNLQARRQAGFNEAELDALNASA